MRNALGAFLLVVVVAIGGCGGETDVENPDLSVGLTEWSVDLSSNDVEDGAVDLEILNSGLLLHEVIIVETTVPSDELETISGVVDLSKLDERLVGELSELSPGDNIRATIDLEPGRYVVFCNMPGHYEAGMHGVLTVSG